MPQDRNSLLLALVVGTVLAAGCTYSGDGDYRAEGIFPFRNYSLIFPEFRIDSESTHTFEFRGYGGGDARVRLVVRSPEPIPFFELSTVLDLTIRDGRGNVVFRKRGPLDQHYQRMVREGETSWPGPNEWMSEYEWEDRDLAMHTVSFSVDEIPLDQTECLLWSLETAAIDRGSHALEVHVANVRPGPQGLTAQIEFVTGWK